MGTDSDLNKQTELTAQTTVEVRCTGHVRTKIGKHSFEYTFDGATLRAFLDSFFEAYDVADMLIGGTEAEATTDGWAPVNDDPPEAWSKNPDEQTQAFARVAINGQFNEHIDGLNTELKDGDRVALMYPFMICL